MNTDLLEKLAKLADELDNQGDETTADDVSELLMELVREVNRRDALEQADIEKNLTLCPKCNGERGTDQEAICSACRGVGFVSLAEVSDELVKTAFIRKRKGKWCVVSKKGKNLGCYDTKAEAVKRLGQVEYFKHNK